MHRSECFSVSPESALEYVVATINAKNLVRKIKLTNFRTNHAERLSVHVVATLKR